MFTTLITFESIEVMRIAMLTERDKLLNLFLDFKPWLESEWCYSRRVWLEYYWVPPKLGLLLIFKKLHKTGVL